MGRRVQGPYNSICLSFDVVWLLCSASPSAPFLGPFCAGPLDAPPLCSVRARPCLSRPCPSRPCPSRPWMALLCSISGLLVGLFAFSDTHITPLESRHQVPPFRHSLPLLVGIDSALEVLATGLWLEGVWLSRMPIFVGHRARTTPHTRGCHAFWAPCPFRFSPCTQIQHVSRNPVPSPTPCKHAIAIATTIPHHITPRNYTTMGFTTLHYNTPHSTSLHFTPLQYTTLHYTTLHYTKL